MRAPFQPPLRAPLTPVALALSLLLPALATAQDPPAAPSFEERVEVTEVLLDVLVTDRDGNVIVGLEKDDFVVEEDGRPIPLIDVDFYSNRPRLDEAGRPTGPAESERYFILFVHDQRTLNSEVPGLFARQMEAMRRARDWVSTLQLDDYVAVVSYDNSLAVHQDFTRDRSAGIRALDDATRGAEPSGNWASRLPPEDQPSLLRGLPRGRDLAKESRTIFAALATVARATEGLVGRKNLVLWSTGFGEVDERGRWVREMRHQDPMEQALNDANVAVYAVDLAPVDTEIPFADALALLAEETGGRYFQNMVNLSAPLQRIAEETSGYYLISYRAQHPSGASGFQSVRVLVENPEFRVTARAGYLYGGG